MRYALHDFPEGLAVGVGFAAPDLGNAVSLMKGIGIQNMPEGLVVAIALLPWGLGCAAGAMLFVISNEIIPETHRRGHQAAVTFALLAGFGFMMALDQMLG